MAPQEVYKYRWKRRHTCVSSLVMAVCAYWLIWFLAYRGWNKLDLGTGAWKRGQRKHSTHASFTGSTSGSLQRKVDGGMAQSPPQNVTDITPPSTSVHAAMDIDQSGSQKEEKEGIKSVVHNERQESSSSPSTPAANQTARGSAARWRDNQYVRQHGILPYQRCKSSDFAPGWCASCV
jgi:hypothetical protein